LREFPGKERYHSVNRIVHPRGNREHRRQSADETGTNVSSEAIGSAEKHCRPRIKLSLVCRVLSPEILRQHTAGPRLMGDEVVPASSNEREVAWLEF
jgi:hypothetical protein